MPYYHYTNGHKLAAIKATDRLLPATSGVEPGETPLVWFSKNPVWEPSATKGLLEDGDLRPASREELDKMVGVYRFTYVGDERKLLDAEAAVAEANMRPEAWASMKRVAAELGADPADWAASVKTVPLKDLKLERLVQGTDWRPMDIADAAQIFKASGGH